MSYTWGKPANYLPDLMFLIDWQNLHLFSEIHICKQKAILFCLKIKLDHERKTHFWNDINHTGCNRINLRRVWLC